MISKIKSIVALSLVSIVILLYLRNQSLSEELTKTANLAIQQEEQITQMANQISKVSKLEKGLTKELSNAKETIEQLSLDINDRSKRLLVHASCPDSAEPSSTVVANGGAAELTATARQDYLHLRADIERSRIQIKGLQGYIMALPKECVYIEDVNP